MHKLVFLNLWFCMQFRGKGFAPTSLAEFLMTDWAIFSSDSDLKAKGRCLGLFPIKQLTAYKNRGKYLYKWYASKAGRFLVHEELEPFITTTKGTLFPQEKWDSRFADGLVQRIENGKVVDKCVIPNMNKALRKARKSYFYKNDLKGSFSFLDVAQHRLNDEFNRKLRTAFGIGFPKEARALIDDVIKNPEKYGIKKDDKEGHWIYKKMYANLKENQQVMEDYCSFDFKEGGRGAFLVPTGFRYLLNAAKEDLAGDPLYAPFNAAMNLWGNPCVPSDISRRGGVVDAIDHLIKYDMIAREERSAGGNSKELRLKEKSWNDFEDTRYFVIGYLLNQYAHSEPELFQEVIARPNFQEAIRCPEVKETMDQGSDAFGLFLSPSVQMELRSVADFFKAKSYIPLEVRDEVGYRGYSYGRNVVRRAAPYYKRNNESVANLIYGKEL